MNTPPLTNLVPPLNVGVYGTTRAGKTRFLYELLSTWQRDYRIMESSDQTSEFLKEIEPDIQTYQHSRGTVKSLEGIRVLVQRGEDRPPWSLTFRDLRGEFLAQEVDDLARASRQASLPRQVRECNSFVFFFDPTSEDAPEQLEAHYARELRRAGRFIDYVLSERQNRYLPILFVLTRLDRWEANPRIQGHVSQWIDRVNEKLRSSYRRVLGGHFPPRLTDVLATTVCLSSVRGNEAEQVIDRLGELVQECDEFYRRDRRRLRSVMLSLTLTLGLFVLLAAGVFWWVRDGGIVTPNTIKQPKTAVRDWTSDEVRGQLNDLSRVLAAHPRDRRLPTLEEARSLNVYLRWLPTKLELTKNDTTWAGLRKEMEAALERIVNIVQAKLDPEAGEPLARRWSIVTAYLEDVPDAPEQKALEQLRGDAWSLGRQELVQQLAEILQRREKVNSPPADTILEVLSCLRTEEQELQRVRIGGLKTQETLISEVRTAATFLEVHKNSRMYRAKFQLVSARVLGANVSDGERGMQIVSPGRELPRYILLKPTRVDASEVTFRTNQPSYEVELGLGSPVVMRLAVWSRTSEDFEALKDFDLSVKGQGGPLRALGLPLLVLGQTTVQKKLEWQGYELKFDWLDLPRAPALLESAATRLGGGSNP